MEKLIKVLVVDDESIAREILETYIDKHPNLELCGSFGSGLEAISYVRTHPVDLVLLDIHMPELDGFLVLELLSDSVKVIFTTAYRSYAIKGFEVNALDYLLKPISFDRFLKAIQKYIDLRQEQYLESSSISNYLFIRVDRKMQKVNLDELLYVESFSDYLKFHMSNGQFMTRETIKSVEERLPKNRFLRCHRSYIVAVDKIEAYTNEHIELKNQAIPISRTYKNSVLQYLEQL